MKIAYFESTDQAVRQLRPMLQAHQVRWIPDRLSFTTAAQAADSEAIAVPLGAPVTREILKQMPALRHIVTRSTGYDHIDVEACRERHISVSNVPYYGENTVAEHTFALILSVSRWIHRAHARTRVMDFSFRGLEGFDLKGRTLGIVGLGRIGSRVARMARAFDMRVIACDAAPSDMIATVLGIQYVPYYSLLAQSDIISLHVPLTPATHHLLDDQALSCVRFGVVIVNTSRGEVVDSHALLHALESGAVAAAALDVLEGEESLREEAELLAEPQKLAGAITVSRALLEHPNVLVTPHVAFFSRDAVEHIRLTAADNLVAFAAGEPQNLVLE